MDKKVNVLLSAYNGEKYIREQIESILEQSYKNIEIYVRDDGSKDGTLTILKEYEERGLIHLEAGKNVGFVKSFEWLIANGGEADYYAFSDQDDFWFPDKIKMALELLDKSPSDVPVLYFSNYDYYDGELNFVAHRDCKHPNISFANSMVDCVSLGFNSVFNRKAKDMVTEQMPKYSTGHDWWMYMVCVGMGKVIYDERATVKYRRTGSNVSNSGDSFWKAQVWRFKKFFLNHYFKYIRRQIREYAELYKDKLSEEDRKTLYLFTQEGFHPIVALKKVFYPHKLRQGMIDEKTALKRCEPNKLDELLHPVFDKQALKEAKVLTRGLPASMEGYLATRSSSEIPARSAQR